MKDDMPVVRVHGVSELIWQIVTAGLIVAVIISLAFLTNEVRTLRMFLELGSI